MRVGVSALTWLALAVLLPACGQSDSTTTPATTTPATTPSTAPAAAPEGEEEVVPPSTEAVPGVPTTLKGSDQAWVRAALSDADRELLENAPQLVLYALDPIQVRDGVPSPQARRLQGYGVLGQAEITQASERKDLIEALYSGLEGRNAGPAGCFLPRHALSASRGTQRIDLLICFQCTWVHVHSQGAVEGAAHLMGSDVEPVFDTALKAHGLPKHGAK